MTHQRQTSRSLAVRARSTECLAGLLLFSSACSFSENGAFDQAPEGSGGLSQGSEAGTTTAATTTSEGEDGGTDTSGGDEENDTEPQAGPEDPDLDVELCDPASERVLAYGLEQANAQAEPVLVRESVLANVGEAALVPAIPLSARPFLNYFDFFYPPAAGWDPEISGELWQSQMGNGDSPPRYRLQYAIRGPEMSGAERLPVDLAIVVDLGPVMAGEPFALAEEAIAALDAALVPGDRVSLIAAGPTPTLLGTTMVDEFGLSPLAAFNELDMQDDAGALADVGAALELAYGTITESWVGQGQPRVLLISNGHFEIDAGLLDEVEAQAADGRYLISVGVGDPEQFDGTRIAELAREGRGSMLFARSPDDLWLELEQDFSAHMIACASDVEVTLTLPPGLGLRERDPYIGAKIDPKLAMLGPNHALVFHHELEACSELPLDAVIRVEVEWTDPKLGVAKQAVWEQPVLELAEVTLSGQKGAATVAYARALRAIRDGGDPASYGIVLDALSLISDALAALPEDQELIEMSAVIAKLTG
jgi:hypothetical protein